MDFVSFGWPVLRKLELKSFNTGSHQAVFLLLWRRAHWSTPLPLLSNLIKRSLKSWSEYQALHEDKIQLFRTVLAKTLLST
jgi:hypothetical protein